MIIFIIYLIQRRYRITLYLKKMLWIYKSNNYFDIFVREPRNLRTASRSVVKIVEYIEDVESATLATKTRTTNKCSKNIAKALFSNEKSSADEGCLDAQAHQCHRHAYKGSSYGVQLQVPNSQCTVAIDSKNVSAQSRGRHISDTDVIDVLNDVYESNNDNHTVVNIIF